MRLIWAAGVAPASIRRPSAANPVIPARNLLAAQQQPHRTPAPSRLANYRRSDGIARASSGEGSAEYEALLDELQLLPYTEIQARLKVMSKPAVGTKAKLTKLLADTMMAEAPIQSGGAPEPLAADTVPLEQQQYDDGSYQESLQTAPAADAQEEDFDGIIDGVTLRAELGAMRTEELTEALTNMGMSLEGDRSDLVERLAVMMENDMLKEEEERQLAMQQEAQLRDAEASTSLALLDPEDQALLFNARTTTAYEGVVSASRPELYRDVKALVGGAAIYGTRDELAQQLAALMAQRALAMEAAAPGGLEALQAEAAEMRASPQQWASTSTGLGVTGIANCGQLLTEDNVDTQALLRMTLTQLKRLRIDEMRVALEALGESSEGTKDILSEQLVEAVMDPKRRALTVSRALGAAAGVAQLDESVRGMPFRNLRAQLTDRDLEATGSRQALEDRLITALREEAGLDEPEEEEEDLSEELLPPWQPSLRLVQSDPALTVAVLFGAPGGTLDDLQASLEAAQCAVSGLQTAWVDTLAGEEEDPIPGISGVEPGQGVHIRLVFLRSDMTALELPAIALRGITAAELLAGAVGEMVALYPSVAALQAGMAAPAPRQEDMEEGLQVPGAAGGWLSVVSASGLDPAGKTSLGHWLAPAGVHTISSPSNNKFLLADSLTAAGWPVLPSHRLLPRDLANVEGWTSRLEVWADQQGYHHDHQLFVVKPAEGSRAQLVTGARGLDAACKAALALAQSLADLPGDKDTEPAAHGVLVEPNMAQQALHFTVTVLQASGGPLALLPSEVVVTEVEDELFEGEVSLQERRLRVEGYNDEEVAEQLEAMRAAGAAQDAVNVAQHHRKKGGHMRLIQYHNPPRLPRKLVHALRHGAAALFTRLGLTGAATLDGWVQLSPGWQDKYERPDDGLGRHLPCPGWLEPEAVKLQAEAEQRADEANPTGPPLSTYMIVDPATGSARADLTAFEARTRLSVAGNKEANIYFTDVNPGLELDPGSPVYMQAAEVGMGPATLLRNVVNAGQLAAAMSPPLLSGAPAKAPARKSRAKSRAASAVPEALQSPASASPVALLEAPPPLDPQEMAACLDIRPDDFDWLHGTAEWRRQYEGLQVAEKVGQMARAEHVMEVAELLNDALDPRGPPDLTLPEDNMQDAEYNWAEDWNPEALEGPAALLSPEPTFEEEGGRQASAMDFYDEDQVAKQLEALRVEYPLLPEEDLMWVRLGHGPEGQLIDTAKLRNILTERIALGEEFPSNECLLECLIDPVTGQVGLPDEDSLGPSLQAQEDEYEAHDHVLPEEEAEGIWHEQRKFANSRYKDIHKVWLLVGGDAAGADQSIAAARHVALQLGQCTDIQVDIFLLAPGLSPREEARIRTALMARRTEWLASGFNEGDLPASMSLTELRNHTSHSGTPQSELVWVLPTAAAHQNNAYASHWAAEAALRRATTSPHALPTLEQQALEVALEVQLELAAGGLQGVGNLFGGVPEARPVPPRCLTLLDMAQQAAEVGALVVPMMRGAANMHAAAVQLLHDNNATYTGPGPMSLLVAANKVAMSSRLEDLGHHVTPIGRMELAVGSLIECSSSAGFAEQLIKELRVAIFMDPEVEVDEDEAVELDCDPLDPGLALCLRPVDGAAGLAVVPVSIAQDLVVLGTALAMELAFIPADTLSCRPHKPIPMPRHILPWFMVEAWVECDHVMVTPGPSPNDLSTVTVEPVTGWLEATLGFLGDEGTMQCLGISVAAELDPATPGAHNPPIPGNPAIYLDDAEDATEGTEGSRPSSVPVRLYLTPPPESVLSEEAANEAMLAAGEVVDDLLLQGLVAVDVLINRETGEIRVMEVDASPDLNPGSVLWRQAAGLPECPLSPAALLRELLNTGVRAQREPESSLQNAFSDEGEEREEDEGLDEGQAEALREFDAEGEGEQDEEGDPLEGLSELPEGGGGGEGAYLSSSGRGARRGQRPRDATLAAAGIDDVEIDQFSAPAGGEETEWGNQGPGEVDFTDSWSIRNN